MMVTLAVIAVATYCGIAAGLIVIMGIKLYAESR